MGKIAVIYWSGTGNTEQMAQAISDGIKAELAEADLFKVSEITDSQACEYKVIAFGCPAMGAEVLEEEEFEPFFSAIEPKLAGKKVALFGSYGWGDGEWMRNWENRVTEAGGLLIGGEGLIINDAPDAAGTEVCVNFGKTIAKS